MPFIGRRSEYVLDLRLAHVLGVERGALAAMQTAKKTATKIDVSTPFESYSACWEAIADLVQQTTIACRGTNNLRIQ